MMFSSYLYNINPRTIEEVVAHPTPVRSLSFPFFVCYFLGVKRHLRVCPSAFPLRKWTRIDYDHAIDHLEERQPGIGSYTAKQPTLTKGASALGVINMSGLDVNHSPSFR